MVNERKTKVMIFRKGSRLRRNLKFHYNETEIEIVSKFNYLGMVFTTGGSFAQTMESLNGQALKGLYKLQSALQKYPNASVSHRLELFDKLIVPILNYGSEVWGYNDATQLETFHLQYLKQLLGVKKPTQNNFIYGELGRFPLKVCRTINIIRYWLKVVSLEDKKFASVVYKMMLNDLESQQYQIRNWAFYVKQILERLGFGEVWYNQGVGNKNQFLSILKQRVKDNFTQVWYSELNTSTRASTYVLCSNFEFKMYLDNILTTKYRYALTRLRTSSHRLEIETGRWTKPHSTPRSERKCHICQVLEDEFHFILECPLYEDLRAKYIKKYIYIKKSVFGCVILYFSGKMTT